MTLRLQAARGLKWQAIEIAGRQLLSLVVFTTLARLLDPSAFGLVGLVAVYLAFVGMFAEQGLGTAIVQRLELEPEHLNAAFWFNLGCATILCVGTIASAEMVARLLADPRLEPLLRWGSLSLVINALASVQNAFFMREMDFRRPALRTLIANIAAGAVGVSMAVAGFGVWALIGQQLTASIAGTVFIWMTSQWRPSRSFSFRHLRQLLGVSSSVFGTGLLWFFSSRLDQIVIGRFAGAAMLGQYVVGGKLAEFARMAVHQPVAAVSIPALSRLQHDYARMRGAIYSGMELNALVSFPVFIGLAAVGHDLVPLAFGAKWAPASGISALLALYTLTVVLQVFFHPALIASGGPGAYVVLNVFHTLGVAVACVAGIRHGVYVLIIGLIINSIVIAVPALWFLRRRVGLSAVEYCRPCLVPAVAAAMMFAWVWAVRVGLSDVIGSWLRLAVEVSTGIVVYVGVTALVNPGFYRPLLATIRGAIAPESRSAFLPVLTATKS